jgi:predicted Zn-dependent peptidase
MEKLLRVQPPVFPVERVSFPEVKKITLSNGIPVYLIEAGTEEITRIEFTFRAGQIMENRPLLASTVNMMLAEGSVNYTSEELHSTLDFYGAFLHPSVDKDRAGIVLFTLNKHFERILELGQEMLFRPVFPEKELNALMKKRLQWYFINREKVQNLAYDQFFESVFGKEHPYGFIASEDDFMSFDNAVLKSFHTKNYSPGNMAIIISGIIPVNTQEILENKFGSLDTVNIAETDTLPAIRGTMRKKVHVPHKGNLQTAIRIGSSTINKRNSDYPGLKVLDTVLGGYFGSRLMKNIREEKGYTYGIRSSVSSLAVSGYKVITTEVGNENRQNAIDEIYKEIRILQNELIGTDELDVVKNYLAGELLRMFDGPFAIAESFKSAWEFGLDNNYYNKFAEKIRTIGPDEIKSLANTYYNIDDLYEITAGSE